MDFSPQHGNLAADDLNFVVFEFLDGTKYTTLHKAEKLYSQCNVIQLGFILTLPKP